jgi:hypothetical protein
MSGLLEVVEAVATGVGGAGCGILVEDMCCQFSLIMILTTLDLEEETSFRPLIAFIGHYRHNII